MNLREANYVTAYFIAIFSIFSNKAVDAVISSLTHTNKEKGLIGTLSIDNEMHDDDVCNPRRIGSRVSFSD